MKIVEGFTVAQEPVWIVVVNAGKGKEIEVGFLSKADAVAYRNAVVALRRATSPETMNRYVDEIRREVGRRCSEAQPTPPLEGGAFFLKESKK
jgi:hypothetical protein